MIYNIFVLFYRNIVDSRFTPTLVIVAEMILGKFFFFFCVSFVTCHCIVGIFDLAAAVPVMLTLHSVCPDIYMKVVGQSAVVDKQILRLQELIEREIDYQQELVEVLGMLDTLFATMTTKKDSSQQSKAANGLLEIGSGRDQVVGAT